MNDDRALARSADGSAFDLARNGIQHQVNEWMHDRQAERMQISKDEVSWVEHYTKPEHPVDVTLNLSCGVRTVPHLMILQVALFRRLGVNFVATAGPEFCCGRVFQRYGMAAGDKLFATSIKRLASWKSHTNVQCCGSCFIEFDYQVRKMREETGTAPFEVVHITKFLRDRLRELGDTVEWAREVPRRVLLHAEGAEMHQSKEDQRGWVIETLDMIPGVEYVGLVESPSLGAPCVTKAPGLPSILNDITPEQYRQVQAELEAQARAVGADAILTHHHMCHREWSKFSSSRLPVIHYQSLLGEALGVNVADRFKVLWQLGDPARIVEKSRPQWESWGMSEDEARQWAERYFNPKYADAVQRCPCEGSCAAAVVGFRGDDGACLVASR